MILFLIPIVLLAFSLRVLHAINHGQIRKNILFLKIINIIHIVAVCFFYLFIFILPFVGGRDELAMAFLIYASFGAVTLMSNIVVSLINRFSEKRE